MIIIEFKAPDKEPNKGQRIIHKMLDKCGFRVYVVDNIDDGKKLFNA